MTELTALEIKYMKMGFGSDDALELAEKEMEENTMNNTTAQATVNAAQAQEEKNMGRYEELKSMKMEELKGIARAKKITFTGLRKEELIRQIMFFEQTGAAKNLSIDTEGMSAEEKLMAMNPGFVAPVSEKEVIVPIGDLAVTSDKMVVVEEKKEETKMEEKKVAVIVEGSLEEKMLTKLLALAYTSESFKSSHGGECLFYKGTQKGTQDYLVTTSKLFGTTRKICEMVYGKNGGDKVQDAVNMMVQKGYITEWTPEKNYQNINNSKGLSRELKDALNNLYKAKAIKVQKKEKDAVVVIALTPEGKKELGKLFPCYKATVNQMNMMTQFGLA